MKWSIKGIKYLAVWSVMIWTLFPIIYLFLTSVKPENLLLEIPPRYVFEPDFSQYVKMFLFGSLASYLKNSLVVATVSTLGALVLGTMLAFAFMHFRFRWKKTLLFLILLTRMFPPITTLIPVYLVISKAGLTDSLTGLILPYIAFQIPLIVWILNDFMKQIPQELLEAAKIDGCTVGQIFIKIVLPLSTPGILASGILAFIYNWNEMLFALTLTSFEAKTLPVALMAFTESEGMLQWASVAAVGMVSLVPALIFFLLLNKFLVKGMMAGAVKG